MKIQTYIAQRQSNRWRENSLERSDENITGSFDWRIIKIVRTQTLIFPQGLADWYVSSSEVGGRI